MSKHGPDTRSSWQVFVAVSLGVLAGTVAAVGALAVTIAGFALSFDAIRAVGQAAHMRADWAWLLPVSVDGAMAVATVAAVVLHRLTGKTAWYPWTVVLVGAAISVACNGLHATGKQGQPLELAAEIRFAVSAIPAVMLAMSVHLLVVLIDVAAKRVEMPTEEDRKQAVLPQTSPASTPLPSTRPPAPTNPIAAKPFDDGPVVLDPVSSSELRPAAQIVQESTPRLSPSRAAATAAARTAPRRESSVRTVPPAQRSTPDRTTSQADPRTTVDEKPRAFAANGGRSRITERLGTADSVEDLEQARLKRLREFMAENPGLKIGEVDEQLAQELNVAPRTVRRLREKLRDQVAPTQDPADEAPSATDQEGGAAEESADAVGTEAASESATGPTEAPARSGGSEGSGSMDGSTEESVDHASAITDADDRSNIPREYAAA